MAGNSELMDIIKKNVDNHHAKLSDSLYEKWLEIHRTGRIENRESAFHLSVIIDLKTATANYSNPTIFLFMGGFMIAIATQKINLQEKQNYVSKNNKSHCS